MTDFFDVMCEQQYIEDGRGKQKDSESELSDLLAENRKLKITVAELIKEMKLLEEQIGDLRREKFKRFDDEDYWIYQESGDNHLDSLVCPVVISAQKLIELGG